jgi:hypothetical protein
MVPDYASYMGLLPEQGKGIILLMNVDHFMLNPILVELGGGAAAILAGEQPAPPQLTFIPWLMRTLLLIPLLQVVGIFLTWRRRRRWRNDPATRPQNRRLWTRHLLPAALFNLLLTGLLIPLLGPMRGFWRLFAPDYFWLALGSGGFAGFWTVLRPILLIRAARE